jgi:hypothetical protein
LHHGVAVLILYRPARVNIRSPPHRAFAFVLSVSNRSLGFFFDSETRVLNFSGCVAALRQNTVSKSSTLPNSIQEAKPPTLLEDRKKAEFTIQLNPHWISRFRSSASGNTKTCLLGRVSFRFGLLRLLFSLCSRFEVDSRCS